MPLRLFDLIHLSRPDIDPSQCKIHFARPNYVGDNPLEVFVAGKFEEWQCDQTKRNFQRDNVLSLITMNGPEWLFAGVFAVNGPPRSVSKIGIKGPLWRYALSLLDTPSAPVGRVVVDYDYKARQTYPYAENMRIAWMSRASCASVSLSQTFRGSAMWTSRWDSYH